MYESVSEIAQVATFVFGLLMVFLALPLQITKTYRDNKSGVHVFLAIVPLGTYFSRGISTFMIDAWWIYIPDAIGVILSTIMLVQLRSPQNLAAAFVNRCVSCAIQEIKPDIR